MKVALWIFSSFIVLTTQAHGQDAIQSCLDTLAQQRAEKKDGGISTPSNADISYQLASSDLLGPRCDEQGDLDSIKKALALQAERCLRTTKSDKQNFKLGCRLYNRNEWCADTITSMLKIAKSSIDFKSFLRRVRTEFDWYRSSGVTEPTSDGQFDVGETQFTAYYTPVFRASHLRQGTFQYAIYKTPADLVQIPSLSTTCIYSHVPGSSLRWCRKNGDGTYSPFFTREQIDAGALEGRHLEIAYLEDPVDVASLMVEGSGVLEFVNPDGRREKIRANFAAMNGRRMEMLGRIVRCDGGVRSDYWSMSGIKSYLQARPDRASALRHYDQSYVFFRTAEDGGGSMGSEAVPVTARHSLAVDRKYVPPGAAVLFDVEQSRELAQRTCPRLSSLALAQDTGGAIKGAHVDWYVGSGSEAAALGDNFNNRGTIYIGVSKNAGRPLPNCR